MITIEMFLVSQSEPDADGWIEYVFEWQEQAG